MRALPVAVLVVLAPVALIGFRLLDQAWSLGGPARGSGTIEGEAVTLSTRIGARITGIPVEEGDGVDVGQVLVQLDCAEPEAQVAELRARVAAARAEADAAAAQADAARRAHLAASAVASSAEGQARSVVAQREAADRRIARLRDLEDGVTEATLDEAATGAAALTHQSGAAEASARAQRLQADVAEGQRQAAEARARAASEGIAAAEAALARAELVVADCEIRAPRAGIVETLPFEVGERVPPGAPVARIVDLSELTATFWLPNAELAAVSPGAPATVTADAWPDLAFAGTVRTIAVRAEFTPRNIQTRTDRDRLVYPVEVTVEDPDGRLRPGMPVEVVLDGDPR